MKQNIQKSKEKKKKKIKKNNKNMFSESLGLRPKFGTSPRSPNLQLLLHNIFNPSLGSC